LATGAVVAKPHYLALLADLDGRLGRSAEGLRRLEEGLAVAEELGERFYEAELHRLRGELALHLHGEGVRCRAVEAEAEASFRRALQISRRQFARAWELRAATSLARLWRKQERREEARAILAPVYQWFTEGLETRDLGDARALLETTN
jgi:predicted ATPase